MTTLRKLGLFVLRLGDVVTVLSNQPVPSHSSTHATQPTHRWDSFLSRHLGPGPEDIERMLAVVGYDSLDALTDAAVPESIRIEQPLAVGDPMPEHEALAKLKAIASKNKVVRSLIGMGYYDTITPAVIQRNILENPGWYTQYTPYQAEIAQGRLEALLNFQTMISELTGVPVANASLLDEATAAAEAMAICFSQGRGKKPTFLLDQHCHPQTINVVKTRGRSMGVVIEVADVTAADFSSGQYCGVLVQYPNTLGDINDWQATADAIHEAGGLFCVSADPLALTLLKAPGEFGADVAIGSTQRFGVPLGFGGPHAAYMAVTEKLVRKLPGRLVGVSKDANGNPALRLAIQTREQHIKRDRATSNICTAQVLLAIIAGMYGTYHGPDGLKRIAQRVQGFTTALAEAVRGTGLEVVNAHWFDTLAVRVDSADKALADALAAGFNLRKIDDTTVGISLDERTTGDELVKLVRAIAPKATIPTGSGTSDTIPQALSRSSEFMTQTVFHRYRAEHEMLRYLHRLQSRDLSLTSAMIPLGSCTMKLNASSEMLPISWPEFAGLHPYVPSEQSAGYSELFANLEAWLGDITGFDCVSLQPNAGSQGEYAGLLAIRGYHESRGDTHRNICLIPVSAHGTNPASAVIAGMKVVGVDCNRQGDIDLNDLKAKASQHAENLAALMITYPSTHGVFETQIKEVCQIVHEHGGQVYMDGANMNAQVGLCKPGEIGADVCHLNLHKTFCIPHGGGGPGMGPIAAKSHLEPFLPGDPLGEDRDEAGFVGPVSATMFGSASILPISWMYIAMMGSEGLRRATQVAILNANYLAKRLGEQYQVLYTGPSDAVAHEFILDTRPFHVTAGIEVDDLAKRLMDYGFHAPTMSWPVAGTLMIEPTESESKYELDRFVDAMLQIREEIRVIEQGQADPENNVLKGAPHTAEACTANLWTAAYSREEAAYPVPSLKQFKFWPAVARIDNPYGDRNLACTCDSVESYAS